MYNLEIPCLSSSAVGRFLSQQLLPQTLGIHLLDGGGGGRDNLDSPLESVYLLQPKGKHAFFQKRKMVNTVKWICMTNQIFPNIFRLVIHTSYDLFPKKVNVETFHKTIFAFFSVENPTLWKLVNVPSVVKFSKHRFQLRQVLAKILWHATLQTGLLLPTECSANCN